MSRVLQAFDNSRVKTANLDLAAVRDTLLYIESDVAHEAEFAGLRAAIRRALDEVARLEDKSGKQPARHENVAVRFVPAPIR